MEEIDSSIFYDIIFIMIKINKPYLIILPLAALIIIAGMLFFAKNNQTAPVEPDYEIINLDNDYNLFIDKKYLYSFQAPKKLELSVSNNKKIRIADSAGGGEIIINRTISFFEDGNGPWKINLNIYNNTKLKSAGEWVLEKNNFLEKASGGRVEIIIEKNIRIDGEDAIVTYQQSKEELSPYDYEKTTVFIRNGKLFEFSTRFVDHEKIWESIRFAK